MDSEKNMAIINNSSWDHTKCVNLQTKASLSQCLIVDEIIGKRERQIAALRRGLERLGILDMVISYPLLTEDLFIHKKKQVTYATLRDCITCNPTCPSEQQALRWLLDYLQERDTSGIISSVI